MLRSTLPARARRPSSRRSSSFALREAALVAHVRSLVALGVDPGDIGVLTATNRDALALLAALRAAGFNGIELESHAGVSAPLIKVGTIQRAKCLEFKQVLLARVDGSLLSPLLRASTRRAREARDRAAGVDVGMAHARDGLWVDVKSS